MKINQSLPRRDAIKVIAISALTSSLLSTNTYASSKLNNSSSIVIVGGGSGAITILSRLTKIIENSNITLIAPNETHIYQPGQIYVASGIYKDEEILRNNNQYIPKDVNWIKESVVSFSPDSNSLTTNTKRVLNYDYLIVATGLEYHYEWIKGLRREDIGTNDISSVYLNDTKKGTAKGGDITWQWFNKLKDEASKNKKLKVLYTMPNTPVKCGAVAQQMLYLSAAYLQKEKLSAEFIYTPSAGRLFGLKPIADKILSSQINYPSLQNKFHHNLIGIDIKNKIATYEHNYEIKSGWDEDFQEWETVEKKRELVKIEYDFIHIVPPMSATTEVANSKLSKSSGHFKGWLDVDMNTLQHTKYKNVFGIGDICGIPLGKTIPTISKQAITLEKNLLNLMQKKELSSSFDGYSVCPIKVAYGNLIMAEFNYDGVVSNMNSKNETKKWWLHDLYKTKSEYWSLTLKGLES